MDIAPEMCDRLYASACCAHARTCNVPIARTKRGSEGRTKSPMEPEEFSVLFRLHSFRFGAICVCVWLSGRCKHCGKYDSVHGDVMIVSVMEITRKREQELEV